MFAVLHLTAAWAFMNYCYYGHVECCNCTVSPRLLLPVAFVSHEDGGGTKGSDLVVSNNKTEPSNNIGGSVRAIIISFDLPTSKYVNDRQRQ